MTIRSRLLLWLLPTFTAFVVLIALFFYWNWSKEIVSNFKAHLQSIVISAAEFLDADDIHWIDQHRKDPDLLERPVYLKTLRNLWNIEQKLPISDLYVVNLEPVKKGEPVLLDEPPSASNPIFDGADKSLAFRQVYLLDFLPPLSNSQKRMNLPEALKQIRRPGEYAFSETQEHLIYFTKEPSITPIYETRDRKERLMTAFAPIINGAGDVVALVGADISLNLIDAKLKRAMGMIILSTVCVMLLVTASVLFIANNISRPVRKLKNAALSIAAGEYGETIHVKGPQEIVDLANTFNTMSECMEEHIMRMRESSIARERLYGEYECSQLLQQHMLQQVVHDFHHPFFAFQVMKVSSPQPSHGVLLLLKHEEQKVHLQWFESQELGFMGTYNLLSHASDLTKTASPSRHFYPQLEVWIEEGASSFSWFFDKAAMPLFWSSTQQEFYFLREQKGSLHYQPDDFLFLVNRAFAKQFHDETLIQEWFRKVLKHFGQEPLEVFTNMLSTELHYLANQKPAVEDLIVLCVKFLPQK